VKSGPLNEALKDIVLLDNEKAALTRGRRVVEFATAQQLRTLRDRRRSLVASLQNARAPR
jgi:hypothetical protein